MNKFVLALITLIIANTYTYAQEYKEKQAENKNVVSEETVQALSFDTAAQAEAE